MLTAGGIYGTISALDEDEVTVEIAPQTEVRVARRAIAGVTRDEEEENSRGRGGGDPASPRTPQADEGSRRRDIE